MNRIGLEKLPPLRKEGFSLQLYTSPSPIRPLKNKENSMKGCQQDIFLYNSWQRDEINNKILKRLYENEIRLATEIRKKEILLQENIEKAVKTLRKVQVRTAFWDKVKDQQRNTCKAENYFGYTKKGNCDGECGRDRTLGGRRHERQQEELNNLVREDGIEKQKNSVKDTHACQKVSRRKETKWEYKERNTQRTTKTMEKECVHPKKMTWHTKKREQTENNKAQREKAVEWPGNEIREWDHKTEANEMVRACDGEKRRPKQADRQITCSPPPLRLPPINSSQQQARGTVDILERNSPEPLPDDGPSTQNTESLQQVILIPESSPDLNVQLLPCKVCHRKFQEDRLEKHISICQKTQKPTFKVYDSSQHRIKGTEIEEFIKKNGRSKTQQNIRQARRAPAARSLKPKEDLYSDYVTCPHCSRRFAPRPAETHIPKCQNIKSRPPPPRQRHQV